MQGWYEKIRKVLGKDTIIILKDTDENAATVGITSLHAATVEHILTEKKAWQASDHNTLTRKS